MKLSSVFKYIILLIVLFVDVIIVINFKSAFLVKFKLFFPFILTAVIYIIIYFVFLKKRLLFFETFFHELTHIFFAIITFKKISGFSATRTSGYLEYQGKKNILVSLSPYFFPILVAIIIPFSFLTDYKYHLLFGIITTVFYISFLLKIISDWSFKDSDLKEHGTIYSFITILAFNFFNFIIIIDYLIFNLKNYKLFFDLDSLRNLLLS